MKQKRVLAERAVMLLIGLVPLVTLAADQPNPPVQLPPVQATASLSDTAWQWQSTRRPDRASTTAADPTRYTIAFEADGSLRVRADCNTVLGAYSLSGSALTITLGPSTLVGCPSDSQADQFVADLSQVATYALAGETLQLGLRAGGQMLLAPHPLPQLAGPTWHLTSYNNGRGGVQSIAAGSQIDAVFGADGRVSGSSGCNRYMGPYQANAGNLSIGPLASTRLACEQSLMDQEAAYLKALESTTRYGFENDLLVLRDASGATQAIFSQ